MLKRGYFITIYAMAWIVFGILATLLNIYATILLLLLGRTRCAAPVRVGIRKFFAVWLEWLRFTRMVRISREGFDGPAFSAGAQVCIANHPGLLDAVFLLPLLPDAVCVFKRAMLRNPFLAPAALIGGHPWCETGPDFVRTAVREIAAGRTLLIFPEGTRTSLDAVLNPILPGFALIAARAGVPVQMIVIQASRDFLPRGRPWWHVPSFPVSVNIRADVCLPAPSGQARETAALVASRFRACLT